MNELTLLNKNDIATASTEQLKTEFAKSLKMTADSLMYMSLIYNELQLRGVDLSEIKGGLMDYLPLIATNQIDARLVVEYAGNKTLLAYLTRLPKQKQQRLIENPVVQYVSLDDNMQKVVQNVDLHEIRSTQIFQVFDANSGEIRDENEQYQHLLVKDKTGKRKSKNRKINKVRIDGEYIVVGSYDISIKAILQALSEKNGKDYFAV